MEPRASILGMRFKEGQVFSLLCLGCEFGAISRGPGMHGQHTSRQRKRTGQLKDSVVDE
jgi:hypothetical protein